MGKGSLGHLTRLGLRRLTTIATVIVASVGLIGVVVGKAPTAAAATAWSAPTTISSGPLSGVSCTSASFCMAVGDSGAIFDWNGTSWSASGDLSTPIQSVSCGDEGDCAAVGDSGEVFYNDGASWKEYDADGAVPFTSVSCTNGSDLCYAVDTDGNAVDFGPTYPILPVGLDGPNQTLTGISCYDFGVIYCAVVDAYGREFVWLPGSAPVPTYMIDSSRLTGVSCHSDGKCDFVDADGNAIPGNNGAAESDVDRTNWLTAVSCPSSTACEAVDADGQALGFDGTTWSSPLHIDDTNYLTSISCPTSSFCMAVDESGNALTYETTQAISFTSSPINPVVDGPSYTVSTAGGSSGSPVILTIDRRSTSGCQIVGSTVSFDGPAGTCIIDANQAGSVGYSAAAEARQTVTEGCPRLLIYTPSPLPPASTSSRYSTRIGGCGGRGPYSFKRVGTLPRGLRLGSGGTLSGKPRTAGTFTFGVQVTNHSRPKMTTTKSFSLVVTSHVNASNHVSHRIKQYKKSSREEL